MSFDRDVDHGTWKSFGVTSILDMQEGLRVFAGPDHWNDPDMMEVGNGMSVAEDRAHFTMWCMLAAPLMAGNDLRNMPDETQRILTHPGAIAINQDSLGIQGFKYSAADSLETWFKPLSNGEWALCFLNRASGAKEITFVWDENSVSDSFSKRELDLAGSVYALHDVWAGRDIGTTEQPLTGRVGSHDVLLLKLRPVQ